MEVDIVQLVGNYGVVGIILYLFIKEFFAYLNKTKVADTLKDANADKKHDTDEVAHKLDNTQEVRLGKLETLYEEHCKVQSETLATIHNGLNSNAKALVDNTKELVRLSTIIEERIPKK